MSFLRMHSGASYRQYIHDVLVRKSARGYLEIGVRDGETLALIDVPSIGVDPNFQIQINAIGRKKKMFLLQMTSDEFFREYDPRVLLTSPIDAVFLDGLHQFEYLLRDFINSEAICHRDSVIMLDDCLPNHAEMTERTFNPDAREHRETSHWWTGDVWKVVKILKKYRPDLHLVAADTQPTGNVAVTDLDPFSTVLRDNYYRIVTEYLALPSNDAEITRFYDEIDVVSTHAILTGFEASNFVGP